MIDSNLLNAKHYDALKKSAIADSIIKERGYRSIDRAEELVKLGFSAGQIKVPGLLLPVHTTDGGNGLYCYRPDFPRIIEEKDKRNPDGSHPNKVLKYEFPKGAGVRLDCPPSCQVDLPNPKKSLWVTEGQKKADSLASLGCCTIALLGVWNFKGRNEFGGVVFLADWDYIALENREVRIVFDSDVMTKQPVQQALSRLTAHLQRKGAIVSCIYLPPGPSGEKLGVDDWLAAGHTLADIESLAATPRPEIKAAPATYELMFTEPQIMKRPLSLIDGRGYAATWLHLKETRRETVSKKGEIIRLDPPQIVMTRKLFVLRDDGVVFGETGGHKPLSELGAEIKLPEIPESGKILSAAAVQDYVNGMRPDPASVFSRLVSIIDQFLDFNRSLATQAEMCEMVACYALSTWFLPAFNVIGNLWSNGDRGSGKTQLLFIVADLSYLGIVLLSGGSYATLRDLADYGATLAFDDAENVADPKSMDPDKRALLLAGNRRGATVSLKELAGDKTWVTRYVDAFTARCFSAIRIPDAVLSSRTIIVPLIRTADPRRANSDPKDYSSWNHDHRQLIDDLWRLALANMAVMVGYNQALSNQAPLEGRALQPWRSLLAVASWLQDHGVTGLRNRMDALALAYQEERLDLEFTDLTHLIIKGLIKLLPISPYSPDSPSIEKYTISFKTSQLMNEIKSIVENEEISIPEDLISTRRLGKKLSQLRFKTDRKASGKGGRKWNIQFTEFESLARAYGINIRDVLNVNGENGENGENGDQLLI